MMPLLLLRFRVDEKAMVMNQYNQIPHPSTDTTRESNAN